MATMIMMVGSLSAAASRTTVAAPNGGALLISGSITTTASGSVTVDAVLWPEPEILDENEVGDGVAMLPVPVEVSGNEYRVRLDPSSVPDAYDAGGVVDIEVTVSSGEASDSYVETARVEAGVWVPAARSSAEAMARSSASGRAPAGLRRDFEVEDPDIAVRRAPRAASVVAAKPTGAGCGRYGLLVRSYDKWVKISDVMPARKRMKGRVIYSAGGSHSIQAALSTGGWHASGSVTRSIGETFTPVFRKRDRTAWTAWKFGEYQNSRKCGRDRRVRAISHQGGFITTARDHPSYRHCFEYEKGTWDRARGTAWTYTAGVEVHGLSLDTQVGYDEKVNVQYDLARDNMRLCGNNTGPSEAQLVMGKKRKRG
ncbi:MAG: hypothetical protein ACRCYQ_09745 [Nocardioides sp.]